MTAAAYLRVSSRSQDAKMQQDAIARAARGVERVTRWYFEAKSGKNLVRPELTALIEDARRGEFSILWVFRLDRLTRSGIRDTLNLLQELKACGCQVKSVADGFSLDGPSGDVILAVISWAAQMERLAIGERISAARTARESKGESWGRPKRCNKALGDRVFELKRNGYSVRRIAQAVGVPKTVIQRELASRKTTLIEPLEVAEK